MSNHSYSRCWLHLIWATLRRERLLTPVTAAKVSEFLTTYAEEKGIYLKLNFVNPEHVHALIDLPTNLTIENAARLFKGASSHWINENDLVQGKFGWGRGYGAFSVSESDAARVATYIAGQQKHHETKTFLEEYKRFVKVYGMKWREDQETVKTVSTVKALRGPLAKARG